MYQTMASLVPSVVVTIGAVSVPPRLAHHATSGLGGEPAGMRTDITTVPVGPPAGHLPPFTVENTTCTPWLVVYAAGTVRMDIEPLETEKSTTWPAMPPRFVASSMYR